MKANQTFFFCVIILVFVVMIPLALQAKDEFEGYSHSFIDSDKLKWLTLGFGPVYYNWHNASKDSDGLGRGILLDYSLETKKGLFSYRFIGTKETNTSISFLGFSSEYSEINSTYELGALYSIVNIRGKKLFLLLSSGIGVVSGAYRANKTIVSAEIGFGGPLFFTGSVKEKYDLVNFITPSIPLEMQLFRYYDKWGWGCTLYGDWNPKLSFYGFLMSLHFKMPIDENDAFTGNNGSKGIWFLGERMSERTCSVLRHGGAGLINGALMGVSVGSLLKGSNKLSYGSGIALAGGVSGIALGIFDTAKSGNGYGSTIQRNMLTGGNWGSLIGAIAGGLYGTQNSSDKEWKEGLAWGYLGGSLTGLGIALYERPKLLDYSENNHFCYSAALLADSGNRLCPGYQVSYRF